MAPKRGERGGDNASSPALLVTPLSPVHLPSPLSVSRWDSLLRCGSRVLGLSLSEGKMLDFCDALLRNNPETGNFGSLVALTVATVDEVRRLSVRRVPVWFELAMGAVRPCG